MHTPFRSAACGLLVAAVAATAQPPGRRPPGDRDEQQSAGDPVARLMAYNTTKDGKLTKQQLGDERLFRLFDRADANKDGFVTKDELEALFAKEAPAGGGRGGPGDGPGGRGGPPGGRGGPPDGPGGFGPPRPGTVLPPFLADDLNLTDEQKKKLDALQKEVDKKLAEILTAEQKKQLEEMPRRFGPPGGGPGGPPGGGRPGGPPGGRPGGERQSFVPPPRRDVAYSQEAVKTAVTKSLPPLWKAVNGHTAERTCYTCHSHAVPLLAFVTAKGRGFDVSADDLNGQVEFAAGFLDAHKERMAAGRGPGPSPIGGEIDTTGYVLFALDVAGRRPDATTDVVVDYTLGFQKGRDHWSTPAGRAPTESSHFTISALSVRGVKAFGRERHHETARKRIDSARDWMLRTPARETEDRVFKLIGLKAADADADEVTKAAAELAGTQREDGGWGQKDDMPSDAYATGTALYALHTAGGLATDSPAYRRGLLFLLGTQLADGTWHVKTRSRPIQRYFETGFPHGADQFISTAATGWAATALALDCPKK